METWQKFISIPHQFMVTRANEKWQNVVSCMPLSFQILSASIQNSLHKGNTFPGFDESGLFSSMRKRREYFRPTPSCRQGRMKEEMRYKHKSCRLVF